MMSGQVIGALDSNLAGQYSGLIYFDYSYDKDTLFKREQEPVSATGYSIDIDLSWQVTEQVDLNLAVIDLFHQLNWDQVTHTTAVFDLTPDKASVSGREDYINLTQKFAPQIYINIGYNTDFAQWQVGLDYINQQAYPFLGLTMPINLINSDVDLACFATQRLKRSSWG